MSSVKDENNGSHREDPLSKLTFNGLPKPVGGNILSNPEVKVMSSKRRRHTAVYKLNILKEADLCRGQEGAIAALLRREGLYASHLSQWREQRNNGELSAICNKRGRKPKYSAVEIELQKVKKEKSQLEEKLRQAELIIDLQKKVAAILGAAPRPIESHL